MAKCGLRRGAQYWRQSLIEKRAEPRTQGRRTSESNSNQIFRTEQVKVLARAHGSQAGAQSKTTQIKPNLREESEEHSSRAKMANRAENEIGTSSG